MSNPKRYDGQKGTFGGVDLLERKQTSDDSEKTERIIVRNVDLLDAAITNVLNGKPIGGYETNKLFRIPHEFARTSDITFDRYYYSLNLLVGFYGGLDGERAAKDEAENDIREHATYAVDHGYKFLAVIGGQVTPDALAQAVLGEAA
jgi:hypothetical protein